MADATQAIFTVGMPTLAVLVGILINDSRLSDLRGYMDARFAAVTSGSPTWSAGTKLART